MGAYILRVSGDCDRGWGAWLWGLVVWGGLVGGGRGKVFVFVRDDDVVLSVGVTHRLHGFDSLDRLGKVNDSFVPAREWGEDEGTQLERGGGVYHLRAVIIDDLMKGMGARGGVWGGGRRVVAGNWGVHQNAVVCTVGQ